MGWETRGGQSYFYRKRRDGGRVTSEYVGAGALAHGAALVDREEKERAEQARRDARRERAEAVVAGAKVEAICDLITTLCEAELLALGFRQHKRQWRKKRHGGGDQDQG